MNEFNKENAKQLVKEDCYLVKCPTFCESGFEIAQWTGAVFISQSNGDIINAFVESYLRLSDFN